VVITRVISLSGPIKTCFDPRRRRYCVDNSPVPDRVGSRGQSATTRITDHVEATQPPSYSPNTKKERTRDMSDIRIALIGAGAIGRAHINAVAQTPGVVISGIADPSPIAKTLADEFALAWQPDHHSLRDSARPDGAIVATPNALHVPVALEFVAAGIPGLVENPIADTVGQARRLSEAAEQAGVPLLAGHHRRHNPIIRRTRELVRSGSWAAWSPSVRSPSS
jgi:hypothetical protein